MFDIIGDIHGYASKLEALLLKLGYEKKNGSYRHPKRKALFVGDYIDRGPEIRETLRIIRTMVENDQAIALMGNHEYNALCFHFKDSLGGHLRKHSIKNMIQHYETIKQFQNRQAEYEEYLEWFFWLPLFIDLPEFRATHACWSDANIAYLSALLPENRLNSELLYTSTERNSRLFTAIDETLKGKEIPMPAGLSFNDKDGTKRTDIRIKWWEDPAKSTYKSISVLPLATLPELPVEKSVSFDNHYAETEKPVFFGHYWLKGTPQLLRNNICCTDYSVAKGGYLTAYRSEKNQVLKDLNFVFV
mgnify:CR=1 FL=1